MRKSVLDAINALDSVFSKGNPAVGVQGSGVGCAGELSAAVRFCPRTSAPRRAGYKRGVSHKYSFRLFFFGIKTPAGLWLSSPALSVVICRNRLGERGLW